MLTQDHVVKLKEWLQEFDQLIEAESDNKDIIDAANRDLSRENDDQISSAMANTTQDENTNIATYRKMRRMNMPSEMIVQKMKLDGNSTEVIDAFMIAPLINPDMLDDIKKDVDMIKSYQSSEKPDSLLYPAVYRFVSNPLASSRNSPRLRSSVSSAVLAMT